MGKPAKNKKTDDPKKIAREVPWMAIGTVAAVVAAAAAVYQTWPRSADPHIAATPTEVMQFPGTTQTAIALNVANVGGSNALHVAIDGRYGSRLWTGEWVKARSNQGDTAGRPYSAGPGNDIPLLAPGKHEDWLIINAMDLESEVCGSGERGFPIHIRVAWQNKNGKVFEEIHKHKLLCTRDTEGGRKGKGRAFSFMPEGIVSRNSSAQL